MADDLLKQAEELYEKKVSPKENFDFLAKAQSQFPDNVEILWRFARAHFDMADSKPEDKAWRQDYLDKGTVYASKALQLDDKNAFAHKWFAVMISASGEYKGTKEKIENAYKIKEHALKANELKPKDATTLHLLGRWCFNVASLGWLERKAASAFFATPPESSFDEALKYFEEANEVDPSFRRNLLFLGDTYVQLKQREKAKSAYQKAIDLPIATPFDETVVAEAKQKIVKV